MVIFLESEVVMFLIVLFDVLSRGFGDEDFECYIVFFWIKGWSCLVVMGGCEKLLWFLFLGSELFSFCLILCVLCFLGLIIGVLRCWLLFLEGFRSVYVLLNWGIICWKLFILEGDMDFCFNGKFLELSFFILRGIMDGELWEWKILFLIE